MSDNGVITVPTWAQMAAEEMDAAARDGLSMGDAMRRHQKTYNFPAGLNNTILGQRTQHDFLHLCLGKAFALMGGNPLPYASGHNGNEMAEVIVQTLEIPYVAADRDFTRSLYLPEDDFIASARNIYNDYMADEEVQLLRDAHYANFSPRPVTLQDIRYQRGFPLEHSMAWSKIEQTKWGEKIPETPPFDEPLFREIYRRIKPALKMMERSIRASTEFLPITHLTYPYVRKIFHEIPAAKVVEAMEHPEREVTAVVPETLLHDLVIQEELSKAVQKTVRLLGYYLREQDSAKIKIYESTKNKRKAYGLITAVAGIPNNAFDGQWAQLNPRPTIGLFTGLHQPEITQLREKMLGVLLEGNLAAAEHLLAEAVTAKRTKKSQPVGRWD